MKKEEKVALTGEQIKNISKAWAKECPYEEGQDVCPKALDWVQGFFGTKKKRKKKTEPDTIDQITAKVGTKAMNKIKNSLREKMGEAGKWF